MVMVGVVHDSIPDSSKCDRLPRTLTLYQVGLFMWDVIVTLCNEEGEFE